MLKLLVVMIVALVGWVSVGIPDQFTYKAEVQVRGDEKFTQATREALDLLAKTPPLYYWVIWADQNDVIIHQSPRSSLFYPLAAMTALGGVRTIVVHPLGQGWPAATTAVLFVHEIRHLMNYPIVDECDPWADTYLAATLIAPDLVDWAEQEMITACR